MKNKGSFFGILISVFEDPIYLIFIVLLIIYAFTGSLKEAALILLSLLLSSCIRAYFSLRSKNSLLAAEPADREKIKKKQGTIAGSFSKLSSVLAFAFAAAAVPLLIFELVRPDKSDFSSAFTNVLALMSLGLSIPGAKDGSAMDYAAVRMFRGRDGEQKGIEIRNTDAAECLASCDTALILQPTVFYDNTSEVRQLWYSASVYRESGLFESGLGLPAEKCAAISMILQNISAEEFSFRQAHEDAVLRFNDCQSEGRFTHLSQCTFEEPYLNFPATGDVSLLLRYKSVPLRTELLIRSASQDILNRCAYFRRNDGSLAEMSERYLRDVTEYVSQISDKGLTPYFMVTAPVSVLTDGQGFDYILEAVPAVGGTFPEGNADAVAALEDFGVRPVLVLPGDNRTVRNFAAECGMPGSTDSVVGFDRFSLEPAGSPIEKSHSIFVGFQPQAAASLSRRLRRGGSVIAAVVRKRSDMPVMNDSIVSCAVRDSSDAETCANADSLIPAAGTLGKDGGISGLFSLFSLSVSVCARLFMIRNMLVSYFAILSAAVLFPIIAQAQSLRLSAETVLILGAVFAFALVSVVPEEEMLMQSRKCFERRIGKEHLNILKYCGIGLLSAAAIAVTGVLFFAQSEISGQCFVICSLLLSGPSVVLSERLEEKAPLGIGGINLVYVIYTLLSIIACMGICFIGTSSVEADLYSGTVTTAIRTLAFSLIPALVPLVFSGISFLIAKASSNRTRF